MKKVMILFAALALTACGASNNSAKTGAEVETTTTTTETVVEGTEEVQADSTKCEGCAGDCATCPKSEDGTCNCKKEEAK